MNFLSCIELFHFCVSFCAVRAVCCVCVCAVCVCAVCVCVYVVCSVCLVCVVCAACAVLFCHVPGCECWSKKCMFGNKRNDDKRNDGLFYWTRIFGILF